MEKQQPVEKEPALSIFYTVRVRSTTHRSLIEIVRDTYCKQLCSYSGGMKYSSEDLFALEHLKYASKKPRYFIDAEDEQRLLEALIRPLTKPAVPEDLGSIQLNLFLYKGCRIEVRYVSGESFGTWTPEQGLRLSKDAHPALAGDKKHIAQICSELPQGSGGIFTGDTREEPTL